MPHVLLLFVLWQPEPLLEAVRRGDPERVRTIVESGVPVDAEAANGMTALHLAAFLGRESIAAFLLSRGADVNDEALNGITPLIRASAEGHVDVVKLLVAAGADTDHETTAGETAATLARKNGRDDVVAFFEADAHDLDAQRAWIHFLTAVAHEEGGDTEAAVESYRLALELDVDDPIALYRLARLLESSGARDEALVYFRNFLSALDKNDPVDPSLIRSAVQETCETLTRAGFDDDADHCESILETLSGV